MKTKLIQSKPLLILMILLCSASSIKPQCSQVSSNYSCQVTFNVDIYDGVSPPCSNICQSYTGVVLNTNNSYNINCGSCVSSVCNIVVTITDINGSPVGPYLSDFVMAPTAITGPGTCPTGIIEYDSTTNTFKIH